MAGRDPDDWDELISRAGGLAAGRPQSVGRAPFWRRWAQGLLSRLFRFETYWQHEYNRTLVEGAEMLADRMQRMEAMHAAAGKRLAERLDGTEAALRREISATGERLEALSAALGDMKGLVEGLDRRAAGRESAAVEREKAATAERQRIVRDLEQAQAAARAAAEGRAELTRRIAAGEEGLRQGLSEVGTALEKTRTHLEGALAAEGERLQAMDLDLKQAILPRMDRLQEGLHRQRFEDAGLDSLAFAGRFRGSEEVILERVIPYVDVLCEAGVPDRGPVLDIGCGRGEFLAACRSRSVPARGIENDPDLVDHCRVRGFSVEEGAVPEFLQALPAGRLGAVVSFQLIEHLMPSDLQATIAEAYRALASGGMIILETLNPLCLSVLATTFYLDPTHRRPVHPRTAEFLLESAGFVDVQARMHTPVEPERRLEAPPAVSDNGDLKALRDAIDSGFHRLNDLLFSDQEYHVLGRKP